jgi:hypothetical protein
MPETRLCASGAGDLVLTHDALASRSPDRVEGNPILADRELVHDLKDARPTLKPNELTDPESVYHVSPRRSVEA